MTPIELDVLERLLNEWQVRRTSCSRKEQRAFNKLRKQGHIRLIKGYYRRPDHKTWEEFDAWFDWLHTTLNLTS